MGHVSVEALLGKEAAGALDKNSAYSKRIMKLLYSF